MNYHWETAVSWMLSGATSIAFLTGAMGQGALVPLPEPIARVELPAGFSADFDLSRDGSTMLLRNQDFVQLVKVDNGQVLRRLEGHNILAEFSPTGEMFIVKHRDSRIDIYSADDFSTPLRTVSPKDGNLGWSRSAFSPDGLFMAFLTYYQGNQIHSCTILDLQTGQTHEVLKGRSDLLGGQMALGPNGSSLALGTGTGDVWLWDTSTDAAIRMHPGETLISPLEFPIPFRTIVDSIGFSPDGRYLAAAVLGGRVMRWDVESGDPLPALAFPGGRARLLFSHQGPLALLYKGGAKQGPPVVMLWEFTEVPASLRRPPKPGTVAIYENINVALKMTGNFVAMTFSGDGEYLAVLMSEPTEGEERRTVSIYSIKSLAKVTRSSN